MFYPLNYYFCSSNNTLGIKTPADGKLIIVILWVFGSLSLVAQNDVFELFSPAAPARTGQRRQSPGVERMMMDYLQSNRSASGVEGYRIQPTQAQQQFKQEAQEVRSKLLGLFPESFCDYNAPFMRVRVGISGTSTGFAPVAEVESSFPSCYIVRDASIPLEILAPGPSPSEMGCL